MPEQKKTSGKAVGVTGGGGVGLFLIKLASFITDPTWKDLYIASIPMVSILLSEVLLLHGRFMLLIRKKSN